MIGNKLRIVELSPGLIEIMAIGTAVRRVDGMAPATPALIPQAIIVERDTIEAKRTLQESQFSASAAVSAVAGRRTGMSPLVRLWSIAFTLFFVVIFILGIVSSMRH